jgi:hypothetical protein
MPLDSVISSARSRTRPAVAWSPRASRARASSSSAVTIRTRKIPQTEPYQHRLPAPGRRRYLNDAFRFGQAIQ